MPGLHCTPQNGANPSASGSKWGSLYSPEFAARELGTHLFSHQLQQEHLSASAAWTPPCGSGGARGGEVHHVGALFPHRFRPLHCSTPSGTWLCQDTQAAVQGGAPGRLCSQTTKLPAWRWRDNSIASRPLVHYLACMFINQQFLCKQTHPQSSASHHPGNSTAEPTLLLGCALGSHPLHNFLPSLPHISLPQGLNVRAPLS